mmetsp:Transcript_35581/g.46940  ORF Transcript_35581/g.46940 Transcript_35581/m.46940 type:complete len:456 (-) Transcript_35581:220-1587(-)
MAGIKNESINYLLLGSYALLLLLWIITQKVLIPVPVNLILTSTAIIYIGCHRSLRLRNALDEDGKPKPAEEREVMTQKDAYKFPIVGSAVLFGLYLLFKFLDKDLVNLLLAIYFSLIGVFTIGVSLDPMIHTIFKSKTTYGKVYKLPLIGDVDLKFTVSEMISLVFGAIFSAFYFKTKHWTLNNIFGISFCIQGMERISIGSYKVGAILLTGLFFYDIFWVFGTEVMVTVAKSFDGPIKLLFPRAWTSEMLKCAEVIVPREITLGDEVTGLFKTCVNESSNDVGVTAFFETCVTSLFEGCGVKDGSCVSTEAFEAHQAADSSAIGGMIEKCMAKGQFSMLGLGDIVIPGVFIALLLRFDATQAGDMTYSDNAAFPRPYFNAAALGYMLGLAATVFVMYYFNAAQPALLYLVPACLGASILVGLVRKEFGALFAYSEEDEDDKKKEQEKEDSKKQD